MQLTNIEDQVIVRQSSIAFWSISIFVVIIDTNIATKIEDTAPYLIIQNGYLVVGDRSNIALAGFGIFTLLTVIVFCIVQIRIELGRIHLFIIFAILCNLIRVSPLKMYLINRYIRIYVRTKSTKGYIHVYI